MASIQIKPQNRGLFTKKAKAHHMSVSEFANYVMANEDDFSNKTMKQAVFAHNFNGKYRKGGLTPEKAAIMLHEGEIGGKKITDKQRRYFGYVASKHQDGGVLVDPNQDQTGTIPIDPQGYLPSNQNNWANQMIIPSNNITSNGLQFPIMANGQFISPNSGEYTFPNQDFVVETPVLFKKGGKHRWGQYQAGGTIPTQNTQSFSSDPINKQVNLADLINYSVAQNQNPLMTTPGRVLQRSGLDSNNQALITDITMFNQGLSPNLTPQQRVMAYYNQQSVNPQVQSIKNQLRSFGGDPSAFFNNSPDVNIQGLIGKNFKMGGQYRFGCV